MRSKPSMMKAYMVSMVLAATLPVLAVGYLWISEAKHSFEESADLWRLNHMSKRERELQLNVEQVINYIDYRRNKIEPELRQKLRASVNQATLITDAIYQQNQVQLTDTELTQRVTDTLGHLSNHTNPLHIVAANGQMLLSQTHQSSEGTKILDIVNPNEKRSVKKFINSVFVDGQGFIETHSYNTTLEQGDKRITFAKHYPNLNIIIFSHKWRSEITSQIKQEIIERFGADKQSSLMILDSRANAVLSPSSLKKFNSASLIDNERLILSSSEFRLHLVKASKIQAKTIIRYNWHDPINNKKIAALRYIHGYPEWGWVISSEALLNDFEKNLAIEKKRLDQSVSKNTQQILSAIAILLIMSTTLAYLLFRINARGIQSFISFFKQSRFNAEPINTSILPYHEFIVLGSYANRMLDERIKYEEALRKSRQRFRLALQASNSFMWDIDLDTTLVNISGNFFHVLGYLDQNEREFPISRLLDLCHNDERTLLEQCMTGGIDSFPTEGFEFRLKDANGYYRWFYNRGDVVDAHGVGQPSMLAGLIAEISEQKDMEDNLQKASVAAEDASYARSQFLASMSHELHTPLNAILGNVQILLKDIALNDVQLKQLKQVEGEGFHLLQLINDILEMSKIDSDYIPVQNEKIILRELLHSISDAMQHKAHIKGLGYTEELDPQLPESITTDDVKLKQILLSLVSNAIKHSDTGEVVLSAQLTSNLTTEPCENYTEFKVTDTGPGISREMHKLIFEPFKQLDGPNTDGTGLGLSISQRLAHSIGAQLSLESEPGKGCCFSIRIKLDEPIKQTINKQPNLTHSNHEAHPPKELSLEDGTIRCLDGLEEEHYQTLCRAAKIGDIEALNNLLQQLEQLGLAEQAWLQHCKQLLLDFNLEGLLEFLNEQDAQEALV